MEFVIPASKEELRRDEGKGVYVVRQTFDSDELAMVLEGMLCYVNYSHTSVNLFQSVQLHLTQTVQGP